MTRLQAQERLKTMHEFKDVRGYEWPRNLISVLGLLSDDPLDRTTPACEAEIALSLSSLNDREQFVIRRRYVGQCTFDDISKELNVSKERSRQIELSALRKLHRPNEAAGFILRYGVRAYLDKRLNEELDLLWQKRKKELEEIFQQKILEATVGKAEAEKLVNGKNTMDLEVEVLDLTVRPYNCLKRAGCNTVRDIITKYPTMDKVYNIRNLGRKSLEEIIFKLSKLGVDWPLPDDA